MIKNLFNQQFLRQAISGGHRRGFYGWLNNVANQFDQSRIDEVGPDRAAAEWVVRCGGAVRYTGKKQFDRDYNTLSAGGPNKIQEIDGTDSTIMAVGFPYLYGLNELKSIILKRNPYLDDASLALLTKIKDRLRHLQIISCANVTDKGILSLKELDLKDLMLNDLPSVKDPQHLFASLKKALPDTIITWPDVSPDRPTPNSPNLDEPDDKFKKQRPKN